MIGPADTITEAVDLYRGLAEQRPEAFTPDLATSLNNESIVLADLGRREEALDAITEAVDLYRGLAEQRPEAFTPDLATSLNNQSTTLAGLGRREVALDAITEAVTVVLPLLERHSFFLPDAGLRLAQSYLQRCEQTSVEPDVSLTQRLVAVLQRSGVLDRDR